MSNSARHLDHYRASAAQVPVELERIRELISDNPDQVEEFTALTKPFTYNELASKVREALAPSGA